MTYFIFFIVGILSSVHAADCVPFDRLVPKFGSELAIDVKKAKIQFTPLDLRLATSEAERAAYLLADRESCGLRGECDSTVYVADPSGCYRSVLTFHGKWKRIDRKKGRELASFEIETSSDGERARRRFEYDPATRQYGESK